MAGFALGIALMLLLWPASPRAETRPGPADLQIVTTDAFLARQVEQRVAGISFPQIRHVVIRSSPPSVLLMSADVSAGPIGAPATLELQPVVQNGKVEVTILSAHLAGLPIPAGLVGSVGDAVNAYAERLSKSGARVTGVRVQAEGLEIFVNYPSR